MATVAIGIDLGGTRIKAVAIDPTGKLLHQHYQPTNDGNDQSWKTAVALSVEEIQKKTGRPGSNDRYFRTGPCK